MELRLEYLMRGRGRLGISLVLAKSPYNYSELD